MLLIAYKSYNNIIVDKVEETESDGVLIKSNKNSDADFTYTKLTSNDIIGIYKFKIDKIAYPTIWFKDLLKGWCNWKTVKLFYCGQPLLY